VRKGETMTAQCVTQWIVASVESIIVNTIEAASDGGESMGWDNVITLIVAVAGVAIAFFGTVLAYFAHRREIRRDEVRIRLKVGKAIKLVSGKGPVENYLTIEVVNLGLFPVTIANVGFSDGKECLYPPPEIIETPFRLPAREAKTIYYPRSSAPDEARVRIMGRMEYAFAETQCGTRVEIRPIDRQIKEFLRQ